VCPHVPRIANRTPVLLLQHPRERLHPLGTVRLARLGLANLRLAIYGAGHESEHDWLTEPLPAGAALLFPAPGARDLASLTVDERPNALVVLDGTWSQARSMWKALPALQTLPRVVITPRDASLYRVRREPAAHCRSTIEAIVQALEILEPETEGFAELLAAFSGMIDTHLGLRTERRAVSYARTRRARPARRLPTSLALDAHRLVVVYGEMEQRGGHIQLVHWTAERLSGESFAALVRPAATDHWPDEVHLAKMGLSHAALCDGLSLDEVRAGWARFVEPGDVLLSWNASTFSLLEATLGAVRSSSRSSSPSAAGDRRTPPASSSTAPNAAPAPRGELLKAAYCNLRRRGCGELVDVLAQESLRPQPTAFLGRAGTRMGEGLAMASYLADLARRQNASDAPQTLAAKHRAAYVGLTPQ